MTIRHLMIGALAVFTSTTTSAAAQESRETARVAVAPESRLWIDGTSNLHSWSCKAESLDASVEIDRAAAAQLDVDVPKALKRVEVKVPVKSLKCGHGAMDDNLYKALNADATPEDQRTSSPASRQCPAMRQTPSR